MAEALTQAPPTARATPELSVKTQRLEELAIKQSRQFIPVTPSIAKGSSLSLFDKANPKTVGGDVCVNPVSIAIPEKVCDLMSQQPRQWNVTSIRGSCFGNRLFSGQARSAVPLLLVNGTYRKTVRAYLDSSILQYQLQRLNDHTTLKGLDFVGSRPFWIDRARDRWITSYMFSGKNLGYIANVNASRLLELMTGAHANSRSTLEVPIFWFIHGDPLLVDKHLQAKALSDMVIVIQSDQSFLESPLQCNGKSLLLDLRRPIKPAMAAISKHLAGLLPLPISYSQAHESAIEDWTWSVGCNPLSMTSQGWHISQFQTDTIARSYIITALEESVQSVKSAIHLLLTGRTIWVHVNTSPFRVAFVGKCNMKLVKVEKPKKH
ncbi:hypothetical protein ACFE04_009586 [Oxalis oulophora]